MLSVKFIYLKHIFESMMDTICSSLTHYLGYEALFGLLYLALDFTLALILREVLITNASQMD